MTVQPRQRWGNTPPDVYRGGTAQLFIEHPDVMDYVARVLTEGGATGAAIFDGLVKISETQGETFIARGLARPDLDPVWSVLNPVLVRVAASVFRRHIERHIPGPLYTREQTLRWDEATTNLIRHGQLREAARDGSGGQDTSQPERDGPPSGVLGHRSGGLVDDGPHGPFGTRFVAQPYRPGHLVVQFDGGGGWAVPASSRGECVRSVPRRPPH